MRTLRPSIRSCMIIKSSIGASRYVLTESIKGKKQEGSRKCSSLLSIISSNTFTIFSDVKIFDDVLKRRNDWNFEELWFNISGNFSIKLPALISVLDIVASKQKSYHVQVWRRVKADACHNDFRGHAFPCSSTT